MRNKSAHIITTNFEHSSVIAPINYLQIHGFEVDIVDNNNKGIIEIEALEKLIKSNTTLISITAVNSEIGIINPIEEIANLYGTDVETLYNLNPEAIKKSGSTYTLENDSILVPKFAKKSEVILEKDKQLTNQQ